MCFCWPTRLTYSGVCIHSPSTYPSTHSVTHYIYQPFIHIPIYPHISLSIPLSLYLSIHSSICPPIYPPIHIYQSRDPPVHWPMHPYIYPSIHPFVHISLSAHPLNHPSTRLFVGPVTHSFLVQPSVLSVPWPIIYPPHSHSHSLLVSHLPMEPSTHLSTHLHTKPDLCLLYSLICNLSILSYYLL